MKDREIEVKILNINLEKMLKKFKKIGAKKTDEHFFTRIILDYPGNKLDKEHAWVRLRGDGKKTTLTYKKKLNQKIDGMKEIEVEVSDFNNTLKLLKTIGLEEKRTQENRRIKYMLNNVEITIELWPKIPPFMEVEAKTKKELLDTLKILGIDLKDTTTETPRKVYKIYGIDLDRYKNLKLENAKKKMIIR